MYYDLTRGKISRSLILFALPMIAGNLLQQFYNIADTLIVGRVLGSNALAAIRLLLMGVLPFPTLVADNSTGEENGRCNDNKT